jgi:hypothetical protein
LPAKWPFHTDSHHAEWCLEQLFTQHRFPCKQALRTMFPGRFTSRFADITWPARSPYSASHFGGT